MLSPSHPAKTMLSGWCFSIGLRMKCCVDRASLSPSDEQTALQR